MRLAIAAVAMIALGGFAAAQHQHGQHQQGKHGSTPYAGQEQRAVKALSEQQIADLRAGRGMGLALAAELNGYPGPLHVLELADQLALSGELRGRMRELFDAMKTEAVPMGETLIAQEAALDGAFANRSISAEVLAAAPRISARRKHGCAPSISSIILITADLLSPDQRHRYAELRGYR